MVHRITTHQKELENEIKRHDFTLLREWVKLSKKELEHRIRFSTMEETSKLQGALRVLDDIGEILNS